MDTRGEELSSDRLERSLFPVQETTDPLATSTAPRAIPPCLDVVARRQALDDTDRARRAIAAQSVRQSRRSCAPTRAKRERAQCGRCERGARRHRRPRRQRQAEPRRPGRRRSIPRMSARGSADLCHAHRARRLATSARLWLRSPRRARRARVRAPHRHACPTDACSAMPERRAPTVRRTSRSKRARSWSRACPYLVPRHPTLRDAPDRP